MMANNPCISNERTNKRTNVCATNNNTKKAYPNATYVVATSRRPEGPFTVVTQRAALANTGAGDFDVMVDCGTPDSSLGKINNLGEEERWQQQQQQVEPCAAYIAYDAWSSEHRVQIQQLNDEFTDVAVPVRTHSACVRVHGCSRGLMCMLH